MFKNVVIALGIFLIVAVNISFGQEDYVVGPGDVLNISVYGHDDLATTVRVSGDNKIVVPLLDQVEVAGLTITQASQKISALLADGYIINPQVNVFVAEYRSQKATILGQVNSPGLHELRGPTTLLELISAAGGLTSEAGYQTIIKRKVKKAMAASDEQVIVIDMKKLIEQGDTSQNIQIVDGDNIFVSKAGIFYVNGKVERPGSYKIVENLTMIKAISIAGGFSDTAAKSSVSIIRNINGQNRVLEKVSLDEPILPDDVIVVPESFF